MKKLLFVVNDLNFFISHRLPLALAAQQQGYLVSVAGPTDPGADEIIKHGLTVYQIPFKRSSMRIKGEINTLLELIRLFKKAKPDIVHLLTIKPILYGCIAACLAGVKQVIAAPTGLGYVFSAKGLRAFILRNFILAFCFTALRLSSARVIFQNPDDRDLFVKHHLISKARCTVILGSGVDPEYYTYQAEPEGILTIILAARLRWDKGVAEFIEAAQTCRDAGIEARFALVGKIDTEGPNAITEQQIQAWVEQGVCEWWGYQTDMRATFAMCHVVCLPSKYREGVPKVLIEAAACGKPIVTTDIPGCREIVKDQFNGLLIPPGDSQAIFKAIKTLVNNPNLRKSMGQQGRQRVIAEYSLNTVIAKTLQFYWQKY